MRTPIPIFTPHPAMPSAAAPVRGIALTRPRGRQACSAWLFGALTLSVDEARERGLDWLLWLNVSAISETDQIPQIAALCRVSTLHRAPRWQALPDGVHARVGFALDLQASFRYPLRPERAYVHVSACELCSEIVAVDPDRAELDAHDEQPGVRLVAAYTAARERDWSRAAALFEQLLDDRELREDVDACHLYNGACVLARAGFDARALAWLREDTQRRVHAHTRAVASWLASDFGDDPQAEQRHRLEAAMREHCKVVEGDPDLDVLGERRKIDALLDPDPAP